MKINYLPTLAILLLIPACKPSNSIDFKVNAPGINSGTFVIKDDGQKTIYGENIKNGKGETKGLLDASGFYELDVATDGDKRPNTPFEIYLEPATYNIAIDSKNINKYPKITTTSARQQEVSDYNTLFDDMAGHMKNETDKLNAQFESKSHTLSADAYKNLLKKIDQSQADEQKGKLEALTQFVKSHPQSVLAAHFMAKQEYSKDPIAYGKLFDQLSPEAKNSFEGKEVAKTLNAEKHLQLGKTAPEIAGKLFDGKPFATAKAGKKLFLIDFWRSANSISRTNHEKITEVYKSFAAKGFQVISVSLDSKPLWWSTAVKDDKLPWPQISDLKGNDSPNASNWHITQVPTYYLVDGDWNIYKKDVTLSGLSLNVTEYFEKGK